MQNVIQLFYKALERNIDTTQINIIYPNQEVEPTLEDWIRPRLLNLNYYVSRDNCELGYGSFHIGVFSINDNEYHIWELCKTLKSFLHKQTLENSICVIRCLEFQVQALGAYKNTVLERLVYNVVITLPFTFERFKE